MILNLQEQWLHFTDKEIFEETVYDYDILKQRLREMAFLTKGLKIILRDDREEKKKRYFTMKVVLGNLFHI